MGLLSEVSRDEVVKRVPGRNRGPFERAGASGRRTAARVSTRTGRAGSALRTGTGRKATAVWGAAKGLSATLSDRRKQRWRKRAGVAAGTAAGVGAAAGAGAYFLDSQEGRRRRERWRERISTALGREGAPDTEETRPSAENGHRAEAGTHA